MLSFGLVPGGRPAVHPSDEVGEPVGGSSKEVLPAPGPISSARWEGGFLRLGRFPRGLRGFWAREFPTLPRFGRLPRTSRVSWLAPGHLRVTCPARREEETGSRWPARTV